MIFFFDVGSDGFLVVCIFSYIFVFSDYVMHNFYWTILLAMIARLTIFLVESVLFFFVEHYLH
jgi:hypothetical protein